MKHLEAGLIVGLITAAAIIIATMLWAFLNIFIGPVVATVGLLLVVMITTMAVIVDWRTEKKGS
jgi:uncharacterized RDD family membrane protein YckC